ncbi:hypothetical protein BSU04_15930 [Caballeronia sordidicola]|uniref:Uncharacterized protein n=1 Tax=Caballeronia sordidicola TaxID=196367 RepID=A0A226X3Q0_CABSO|nr:hypothetical protein BSU04_15930 [Caballeronia sordidicola]
MADVLELAIVSDDQVFQTHALRGLWNTMFSCGNTAWF